MSKIWKNNDIIGSADAQRWEDKADSKDLQDLQDKIETEGVDTAKRLKTGRQIALSGHVSGSTVFDGSQNVNISATIANASTSGRGLVQLSNDTNSTKENVAATSKAVSYKADKSVAQMWKMTQDFGYGQVKICPENPEDINETALFFATGGTNLPPTPHNRGPYWYILGFRASDWGRLLVAFHNTTGTIYMKQKNGDWGDWEKIPTISDLSKKADINKAQMWKLTQDDGKTLRNDGEDVTQFNKCAFFKGTNLKNLPNGFTDFCLTQVIGDVNAHSTWVTDLSSNKIAIKTNLSDWKELATTDITDKLKTDLTKATTVQLASGNNLNDYFDHNGEITGINLIGAPLEMNGHNVIVECSSYTNTGSTQEITDLVTGVKMLRTYTSDKWTRWQKLGGIDAKIYDIVMSGGIKPSKYAREYDNKIVVYDGVAHLKLNLDATKASTARIFIPKEVAIQVKSNPTTHHDGNIHMNSAAVGWAHYETEDDKKTLKVINHEAEKEMLWLNIPNNGYDWVNATNLPVRNYNQKTDHHVGYFSWYVGGVN